MSDQLFLGLNDLLMSRFPSEADVVQETLIRVLQRVRNGPAIQGDMSAFAVGVARRVRLELRRKEHHLTRELAGSPSASPAPIDIPIATLKFLTREALSKTEREIFEAYFLKQPKKLSAYRQRLASRLGLDIGTLYQRASRYRARVIRAYRKRIEGEAS